MAEAGSKSYKKGALIYIESEEDSSDVFVVETGEVALTGTPGLPTFRSSLGPGDIFGFTSCLCRRPRMETAVARTDATCAVLTRERFIERVQGNPELASRIISYFAQELRAYDDLMTSSPEEAGARTTRRACTSWPSTSQGRDGWPTRCTRCASISSGSPRA